jgi:hypothetical protein
MIKDDFEMLLGKARVFTISQNSDKIKKCEDG